MISAVVQMEDDQDFNAGTGSVMRVDGSIQMDAAVMIPGGRFGAVAAIERVKNLCLWPGMSWRGHRTSYSPVTGGP